jgi:hypothetical protein
MIIVFNCGLAENVHDPGSPFRGGRKPDLTPAMIVPQNASLGPVGPAAVIGVPERWIQSPESPEVEP